MIKRGVDSSKQKVTLSLDSMVYDEFRKYCKDNAIMLSKKIEIFMNGELIWHKRKIDRRRS